MRREEGKSSIDRAHNMYKKNTVFFPGHTVLLTDDQEKIRARKDKKKGELQMAFGRDQTLNNSYRY